jgi:hypothetical protein
MNDKELNEELQDERIKALELQVKVMRGALELMYEVLNKQKDFNVSMKETIEILAKVL